MLQVKCQKTGVCILGKPTLLTPLYTSIILGSSCGIGHPDTSDITVPTSVCFSVIFSMIISAKVRLQEPPKQNR